MITISVNIAEHVCTVTQHDETGEAMTETDMWGCRCEQDSLESRMFMMCGENGMRSSTFLPAELWH